VKAINLGLNRFDDETKQAFMGLYDAVDADVDMDACGNVVPVDNTFGV
jgi:hypothetical protein